MVDTPPVSLPDALREKLDEYAKAYACRCQVAAEYEREEVGYDILDQAQAEQDAELVAFVAALAPYLADSRRLDWLSQRATDVLISPPGNHDGQSDSWFIDAEMNNVPGDYHEAPTLRAAIDAASRAVPPAPVVRAQETSE